MGVPKLSQFGLLRLWQLITPCSNLRSGWGLKQTCSFPWELSNGVSQSARMHQGRVDSWLLVVGSQTANLTFGPSFAHNLCCRCPNERPFSTSTLQDLSNGINNTSRRSVLTPAIKFSVFGSPGGLPSPNFGSVSVILTLLQSGVATGLLLGCVCYIHLQSPMAWDQESVVPKTITSELIRFGNPSVQNQATGVDQW